MSSLMIDTNSDTSTTGSTTTGINIDLPSPSVMHISTDDDDEDMANLFSFGSTQQQEEEEEGMNENDNHNHNNKTTIPTPTTDVNVLTTAVATNETENNVVGTTSTSTSSQSDSNDDKTTMSSSSSSSSLFASLPAFLSQRMQMKHHNGTTATATATATATGTGTGTGNKKNDTTTDSFLELLEVESNRSSSFMNDDSETRGGGVISSSSSTSNSSNNNSKSKHLPFGYDAATQDILNWLDDDDVQSASKTESDVALLQAKLLQSAQPTQLPSPPPPIAVPTLVPLPPVFTSFHDALLSKESTMQQIRDLFVTEQDMSDVSIVEQPQESQQQRLRPELYCRMVCQNKSLDTIQNGSLADSFEQWKISRPRQVHAENDNDQQQQQLENKHILHSEEEQHYIAWIRQQQLAERIATLIGRTVVECETDLFDLVLYHHQLNFSNNVAAASLSLTSSTPPTSTEHPDVSISSQQSSTVRVRNDTLLPMVASTLLSATIPVSVAAVVLAQIIPTFIPLLALPPATERWEAALFLHSEFYLLACYHIPLLVIHLDRYIPGWYWPKLPPDENAENQDISNEAVSIGRNLKKQGQIPLSWLVSHLSGECDGTMLPIEMTLRLWDRILTSGQKNSATRFFLTLAVLERQAPALLLLTDDQLLSAVQNVWTLVSIDEQKEENEKEWKHEWWPKAYSLQLSTPTSVLDRLQKVEDDAVQHALKRKQERAEALLRERLEAEAVAYREAQELKAEEARIRLSRARLVAFYRKHAPDKESNIEQIMETFSGRLDVLDAKLKGKYGEGFNPAVKAKPPPPPKTNLLAKMNQRLKKEKLGIDEEVLDNAMEERKPVQVSVFVTAEEVLPVICWSKEATAARGLDQNRRRKSKMNRRNALKFYLIDCRSELTAQEQGRFPTAFHLSPETLHDPEKLQEHEDTLESFRGAVHIVIMGEGFNAIPNLYNQKLSPKLQELMEQDESRTNLCALFFQKRGFCFVSLLTGGFCAAHSWLVRDGPKYHLTVSSVLVDYSPENTLFGQLETLHNASMTEKAQRKMSNLLEASMVTVTKRAIQLERLTAELNEPKDGQRQGFRKLFGRTDTSSAINVADGVENTFPASSTDSASVEKAVGTVKQEGTVIDPASSTTSGPITSDGSSLHDALAAPTTELSEEVMPPTTSPASSSTNSAPFSATTSTSTTNKFGKFFQQTSEVVGVAAAAAAASASSSIANSSSHINSNTTSKDEVSNPFKGFGAAFQQTRARFGNVGGVTATAVSSESTANTSTTTATTTSAVPNNPSPTAVVPPSTSPSTGFGFNSFRKSAMSRVVLLQKGNPQQQQQQQPSTNNNNQTSEGGPSNDSATDDKEISISFV